MINYQSARLCMSARFCQAPDHLIFPDHYHVTADIGPKQGNLGSKPNKDMILEQPPPVLFADIIGVLKLDAGVSTDIMLLSKINISLKNLFNGRLASL